MNEINLKGNFSKKIIRHHLYEANSPVKCATERRGLCYV